MDDTRFDALTRALGGAATRRSALGALAGLIAAGGGALDADARKKRKRCQPECAAGQTCRQGACTCDNGRAVCGASCCRTGQRCEGGACLDPAPTCIPAGQACKGTGRRCCDGRACASGQAGKDDVACYMPAGGACERTADCAYDSQCTAGVCVANERPRPDDDDGGASCAATISVTGDKAANGAALKAALTAAIGGAGTVITLAAGEYELPLDSASRGIVWTGGEVTVQACPGATATISGAGEAFLFDISAGTVTLRDLEIVGGYDTNPTVSSTAINATGSVGAYAVTLERCVVRGFDNALFFSRYTDPASLTIVGGAYDDNRSSTANAPSSLIASGGAVVTCSGEPTMSGCAMSPWVPACGCTCALFSVPAPVPACGA